MKGIIIIPKYYEKWWTPIITSTGFDFSNISRTDSPLYYTMHSTFGFELRYADEVDVPLNTDIVIVFGVPYHNRPEIIPGLLDLSKNTKLVICSGDLHCHGGKLCLDNKVNVFEKCDLIISGTHEYFVEMYPQFLSKYKFVPNCISPHRRYAKLSFNNTPKMRCLLLSSIDPSVYPLRSFIKDNGKELDYLDYLPPKYEGDSYAEKLNSYFCCISTSSVFNYVVSKYFEIPATGSLLLANETNDLKEIGFTPYRHYIPITKDDVFTKISHCIENPDEYDSIRREGMMFVYKNHSMSNRMKQYEKIFNDLVV